MKDEVVPGRGMTPESDGYYKSPVGSTRDPQNGHRLGPLASPGCKPKPVGVANPLGRKRRSKGPEITLVGGWQ